MRINPYESLIGAIEFEFFQKLNATPGLERAIKDGTAKITSVQSKALCRMLKMEESDFWKNLYENHNKKKDEKKNI